jgi:hypothetical protein
MGRPEVTWTGVALRLPDDGAGALPLLRHVILNDQKSATHRLGLVRALCRAADGQAGLAVRTVSGNRPVETHPSPNLNEANIPKDFADRASHGSWQRTNLMIFGL